MGLKLCHFCILLDTFWQNALFSGQTLNANEKIYSADLSHYLILQETDGNLCTYKTADNLYVWCSMKTSYSNGYEKLRMEEDGKLSVYGDDNAVHWGSYQTKKHNLGSGHKLIVTNEGQLNIIDTAGKVVWKTQ